MSHSISIIFINNYQTKKIFEDMLTKKYISNETLVFSIGSLSPYIDSSYPWFDRWRNIFKKKNLLYYLIDVVMSLILAVSLKFRFFNCKTIYFFTPNFNHVLPNVLLVRSKRDTWSLLAEGTLNYRSRKEGRGQYLKVLLGAIFFQRYHVLFDPLEIPASLRGRMSTAKIYCRKKAGLVTSIPRQNQILIKANVSLSNIMVVDKSKLLLVCQHFLYELSSNHVSILANTLITCLNKHLSIKTIYIKPHPTSGYDRPPIEMDMLKSINIDLKMFDGKVSAEEAVVELSAGVVLTLGYSTVFEGTEADLWQKNGVSLLCVGLKYLASRELGWARDFLELAKKRPILLIG